jgi:hypothetical protein
MRGKKTGGRIMGSVDLKPRRNARATSVSIPVATPVAATVATAAGGAAAGAPISLPDSRARARPTGPVDRMARTADLIPYERNARTHSPEQIDKLCRLIQANQFTNRILVAGKHILAGHARRLAALKLGMESVPVRDLSYLSAAQRRALILSDNRSALDAGWDEDLKSEELLELRELGVDLDLTGFDADEISALFDEPEMPPSPPERHTSKSVVCPACQHEFAP